MDNTLRLAGVRENIDFVCVFADVQSCFKAKFDLGKECRQQQKPDTASIAQ